jgi:hypothetical protein
MNVHINESMINALFTSNKKDPDLQFAGKDIDRMLDTIESVKTDFLQEKTWSIIHQETSLSIRSLGVDESVIHKHCNKLAAYRYVDEIHQLHRGKFARWIPLDSPTSLSTGGIVAEIKFTNVGIHITCRLFNGRYVQYAFDECLTYQKLTQEEQTILTLYTELENQITEP